MEEVVHEAAGQLVALESAVAQGAAQRPSFHTKVGMNEFPDFLHKELE